MLVLTLHNVGVNAVWEYSNSNLIEVINSVLLAKINQVNIYISNASINSFIYSYNQPVRLMHYSKFIIQMILISYQCLTTNLDLQ